MLLLILQLYGETWKPLPVCETFKVSEDGRNRISKVVYWIVTLGKYALLGLKEASIGPAFQLNCS